jgi:hypothetical protein
VSNSPGEGYGLLHHGVPICSDPVARRGWRRRRQRCAPRCGLWRRRWRRLRHRGGAGTCPCGWRRYTWREERESGCRRPHVDVTPRREVALLVASIAATQPPAVLSRLQTGSVRFPNSAATRHRGSLVRRAHFGGIDEVKRTFVFWRPHRPGAHHGAPSVTRVYHYLENLALRTKRRCVTG